MFRTLQQNWFSKHANMIMRNLFCKLLIDYKSKPEQTTNCQLSVTTSLIHLLSISDLHTVHTPSGSFVILQIHRYFTSPMLEQRPLASAISPTVLQSNGSHSLLTYTTFNLPMSSFFKVQNCAENLPTQTILQKVISNYVFLTLLPNLTLPLSTYFGFPPSYTSILYI